MMVYDTEKYLLQPHIPGIVLSLSNTPHYNTCLRVYYVGVLDPTTNKMIMYDTEKYLLQPHSMPPLNSTTTPDGIFC